jgi:hypothetical protein
MSKIEESVDFWVENYGSIGILRPYSERAKEWLDERRLESREGIAEYQFGMGGLVVEPRYINDLAVQLEDEGYLVG